MNKHIHTDTKAFIASNNHTWQGRKGQGRADRAPRAYIK